MKKIIISIDGHSACGKSTLAKALANELNYGYIDTGAMYRAVTFYFLENRVNIQKTAEMEKALKRINITFKSTVGGNRTYLNGKDVEDVIRKMFVSKNVSHVAAISPVRKMVVKQQIEMGKLKGIVMEGRDIGTVVFPKAELKIFLTADEDVRTNRRYDELIKRGQKVSIKSIKENLRERDHIDSTRKDSPLRKASEAVLIDNSNITPKEQLAMVLALSIERIRTLSIADKKLVATKPKPEPQKNTRPTASKRTNQPAPQNQRAPQKNNPQKQPNKKVAAQNEKSSPQKKTNQPAPKNQRAPQKKTLQNQPNKKVAVQNEKPSPQKRTNQPTPKNQRAPQKNNPQKQTNKNVAAQNEKSSPQKKTNQPAPKNQRAPQKNNPQKQSNKKVAVQNEKPSPQKRTSQPAPKNQRAPQKKTPQNQPNKKSAVQDTKPTPQKKSNQPIAKSQNSAQQSFLKIQSDEKPAERKTKITPKQKAKQPAKKVVQQKTKPTPAAKKKPNKPAPKVQKNEQKKVTPKPIGETSTEAKAKKVRTKRTNKK